jgi:hypothetical protein
MVKEEQMRELHRDFFMSPQDKKDDDHHHNHPHDHEDYHHQDGAIMESVV